MKAANAGRTIQDALAEAVERSGRLDALLQARRPHRDRTRSRARRAAARAAEMEQQIAEARQESMRGSVG
jgi:hypothetical protein